MYANLKNALQRKGISIKEYAKFLNISEKTIANKFNESTDFTYREYRETCKMLFPEYNPDYLFATE